MERCEKVEVEDEVHEGVMRIVLPGLGLPVGLKLHLMSWTTRTTT